MQIWTGSGARNSPGTVVKATASTHSIQIGPRRADSVTRVDDGIPAEVVNQEGKASRQATMSATAEDMVPTPAIPSSESQPCSDGTGDRAAYVSEQDAAYSPGSPKGLDGIRAGVGQVGLDLGQNLTDPLARHFEQPELDREVLEIDRHRGIR
jgi:hypothetical protein